MDELRLDGRVAIVTGAGGGLGRSHALHLAARGAAVVVNDLGGSVDGSGGSQTLAQSVVEEIEAQGGVAVADFNTVATAEGGEAIVQTALDAFERVDIVVNNAGITYGGAFHNMTPEMVDRVLDVHLKGAFFVTRPAWAHFRRQGYGRVINTTSATGLLGTFGHVNYLSGKTGLWGFTRGLAVEGANHDIKVNAISPWARSRMTRTSDRARAATTGQEDRIVTLGRQVRLEPDLVSPLVVVLAHEDVPFTGHVYSVGGGRIARYFIGLGEGWYRDGDLTPEDVFAHLAEAADVTRFARHENPEEELASLVERVARSER